METETILMLTLLIVIHIANIILHSTGLHLLRSLRRREHCGNQQLFIINLSLVEVVISCINLLIDSVALLPHKVVAATVQFQIQHYLQIIIHTILSVVFYASMLLITVDKVYLIFFLV